MPNEAQYLALAKKRVRRPAEKPTYRKILVYGRNKKGKTRFGLSAGVPSTLVLDPEEGTATMKALNPYVWPITNWQDIQEAYGALRTGKLSPALLGVGPEKEPFTWVSVDGCSKMSKMSLRYVMGLAEEKDLDRKPGMVQQRDYGRSGELFAQMLQNFHALPMNVLYTAQERTETTGGFDDDEDEEDQGFMQVPDLPRGARGALLSIVEVIGRIYTVPIETKQGKVAQRRLRIGLHERYDTGYRSDYILPDTLIDPTLPMLVDTMLAGYKDLTPPPKKKKGKK